MAQDTLGIWFPESNLTIQQYISVVRAFMRDYPELNRLTTGVENSDRMIAWALLDALDDFNTSPPLTQYSMDRFPSRSLLVRGTVITLLQSLGLLMTRNHISFSDGGLQVGISDKTGLIQSWIQLFTNSYEEKKMRLKIALNIENSWGGGVNSEYLWMNGFYGGW